MPRMMASNTTSSTRHRLPRLSCIPEDGCSEDGTGIGPVAWIAILRDGCLLVDIGEENVPDEVREIAGFLTSLVHTPSTGWNEYTTRGAAAQWKGLRYSVENTDRSWTFTCVYNMRKFSPSDAEAFLQEIVDWTATVRQVDAAWLNGGHHACQSLFAPLLQDRLQGLANPNSEAPITILEDDEEEEEEEDEDLAENQRDDENDVPLPANRNEAAKGFVPPFEPPKLRNLARVNVSENTAHEYSLSEPTGISVHRSSDGPTTMDEKVACCDVSLESAGVLHVSAEMEDLWETTLADIPQGKQMTSSNGPEAPSAYHLVKNPPAIDTSGSPKKATSPSNLDSPARSAKSPTRKPMSPGTRRSPIRRKETVQEMVERLARKQAEMEKASKRPGAPSIEGNDKEEAKTQDNSEQEKPSDDSESSTTSATVEEDEYSDGGDAAPKSTKGASKINNEKSCCWMSSPLAQSKPGLLL